MHSQILDRARQTDAALLLIFDEAHLLSGDALVDLRLLVSSAIEVGPPLKILLVGQEHIRQTLKRSEYTDIVNRISVRYQLRPLTKEQTRQYTVAPEEIRRSVVDIAAQADEVERQLTGMDQH